jgi:hypothetical protein
VPKVVIILKLKLPCLLGKKTVALTASLKFTEKITAEQSENIALLFAASPRLCG